MAVLFFPGKPQNWAASTKRHPCQGVPANQVIFSMGPACKRAGGKFLRMEPFRRAFRAPSEQCGESPEQTQSHLFIGGTKRLSIPKEQLGWSTISHGCHCRLYLFKSCCSQVPLKEWSNLFTNAGASDVASFGQVVLDGVSHVCTGSPPTLS